MIDEPIRNLNHYTGSSDHGNINNCSAWIFGTSHDTGPVFHRGACTILPLPLSVLIYSEDQLNRRLQPYTSRKVTA